MEGPGPHECAGRPSQTCGATIQLGSIGPADPREALPAAEV